MGQGDMLYLPPGSSKLVRAQARISRTPSSRASCLSQGKRRAGFHPELMQIGAARVYPPRAAADELFDRRFEGRLESRRPARVSLLQRPPDHRLLTGEPAHRGDGCRGHRRARTRASGPRSRAHARGMAGHEEQEASRIRETALADDGVPDMMFDDDI